MVLGVRWCLHSCHGPFQEWLEPLPACTSLGMSTAALLCLNLLGQFRADWCPCICLFLKPGNQFVLEGFTSLQPSQDILFHACSTVASAEPLFSWVSRCLRYALCRFPEGTPCSKAPRVSQLLSSHSGLPMSQPGQGQYPGCHQAVLQGTAVSVGMMVLTAMRPWPCRCCAQTPLPQLGHLTSVWWAALAETAGSALLVINRERNGPFLGQCI